MELSFRYSFSVFMFLLRCATVQGCLTVSKNTSQFFEGDFVVLTCGKEDSATAWTLKRNTTKETRSQCGTDWGEAVSSFCNVSHIIPLDTGFYWCESIEGASSHSIQLNITGGSVILQSPVLPVMEGDDITLSCQTKTTPSNLPAADFYKDGSLIRTEAAGHMTLHQVTSSDEGLYRCSIRGHGESPSSWISVEGKPTDAATPTIGASPSGTLIVWHLVVFSPYLLSTLLMVSLYRDRAPVPPVQDRQRTTDNIDEPRGVTTEYHF